LRQLGYLRAEQAEAAGVVNARAVRRAFADTGQRDDHPADRVDDLLALGEGSKVRHGSGTSRQVTDQGPRLVLVAPAGGRFSWDGMRAGGNRPYDRVHLYHKPR